MHARRWLTITLVGVIPFGAGNGLTATSLKSRWSGARPSQWERAVQIQASEKPLELAVRPAGEAAKMLAEADHLLLAGRYLDAQEAYLIVLLSMDRMSPHAFKQLIEIRRRLAADDAVLLRREGQAWEDAARLGIARERYTPDAIRLLARASFIAASLIEAETATNSKATAHPAGFGTSGYGLSASANSVLPPFDAPAPAQTFLAFRLAADRVDVGAFRPLTTGATSRSKAPETASALPAITSGDSTQLSPPPQATTADALVAPPVVAEPAAQGGRCEGDCGSGHVPIARLEGEIVGITDRVVTLVDSNGSSQRLVLMGFTRIEGQKTALKALAVGDLVRVGGRLGPAGTLFASELNVLVAADGRLAERVENIRITGVVAAMTTTWLSIRIRSGALLDAFVDSGTEVSGHQGVRIVAVHDAISVEGRVERRRLLIRKVRILITAGGRIEPASEDLLQGASTASTPANPQVIPPVGGTADPNAGAAGGSSGTSQGSDGSGQSGQGSSGQGANGGQPGTGGGSNGGQGGNGGGNSGHGNGGGGGNSGGGGNGGHGGNGGGGNGDQGGGKK